MSPSLELLPIALSGLLLSLYWIFLSMGVLTWFRNKINAGKEKKSLDSFSLLRILLIIGFIDFFFPVLFPVITDWNPVLQILLVILQLVVAIIVVFFCYKFVDIVGTRSITENKRNQRLIFMSLYATIAAQLVTILFSLGLILLLVLGIDEGLGGVRTVFPISDDYLLNVTEISGGKRVVFLAVLGIKANYLIIHHSSIVIVFFAIARTFQEWLSRVKENTIRFFKYFSYGYAIVGLGNTLQSISIFYGNFVLIIEEDGNSFPQYLEYINVIIVTFQTFGMIFLYLGYGLASYFLLNNISHHFESKKKLQTLKALTIGIPILYSFTYLAIFFSIVLALIIPSAIAIEAWAVFFSYILDSLGIFLLPLAGGLYFYFAWQRGKDTALGPHLRTAFISVWLIFFAGNNTLSLAAWFGVIHGQFGIIGAIAFLSALAFVSDHASRHRRMIRKIREKPEDFKFLLELGAAERRVQCWQKVESMVKEGVVKPLTPAGEKPDENQATAEVMSYMNEIETQLAAREARRAARRAKQAVVEVG